MLLSYTPADAQPQTFDYQSGKLLSSEAEAIETRTGWTYRGEFPERLLAGSTLALRALLWVFLKRANPTLKFSEVEFLADEVNLDFDNDERTKIRAQILADKDLDEETRQQQLAAMGPAPEQGSIPDESLPGDGIPKD